MPIAGHSCVRPESDDKNAYRPRHPEDSLLYRTIADHLETFLARQQERGREGPYFVEREMREYLSCGVLACGFLRLVCESCGKDRLLPLSCYPQRETMKSSPLRAAISWAPPKDSLQIVSGQ